MVAYFYAAAHWKSELDELTLILCVIGVELYLHKEDALDAVQGQHSAQLAFMIHILIFEEFE